MLCCGKERTGNYCPECGKAMNKEAGLRGLLRHVTERLETMTRKAAELKRQYDIISGNTDNYHAAEKKRRIQAWKVAQKTADKWQEWQEALIKAIDGP